MSKKKKMTRRDFVLTTAAGEEIALEKPGTFIRGIWEAGGLLAMLG